MPTAEVMNYKELSTFRMAQQRLANILAAKPSQKEPH